MLCSVVQCIDNIILTYAVLLRTCTSAWLRDCILGCIVTLFHCSLSSWKRIAVTSAVHERLFSHVVERAEHHIGRVRYLPRWMWHMPLQHPVHLKLSTCWKMTSL